MFGIGISELFLVAIVALIIVGPKRLPGVLRAIGHGFGEFRRMLAAVRKEVALDDVVDEVTRPLREGMAGIRTDINEDGTPRREPPPKPRVDSREYPEGGPDDYGALAEGAAVYPDLSGLPPERAAQLAKLPPEKVRAILAHERGEMPAEKAAYLAQQGRGAEAFQKSGAVLKPMPPEKAAVLRGEITLEEYEARQRARAAEAPTGETREQIIARKIAAADAAAQGAAEVAPTEAETREEIIARKMAAAHGQGGNAPMTPEAREQIIARKLAAARAEAAVEATTTKPEPTAAGASTAAAKPAAATGAGAAVATTGGASAAAKPAAATGTSTGGGGRQAPEGTVARGAALEGEDRGE